MDIENFPASERYYPSANSVGAQLYRACIYAEAVLSTIEMDGLYDGPMIPRTLTTLREALEAMEGKRR